MAAGSTDQTSHAWIEGDRIIWRLTGALPVAVQVLLGNDAVALLAEADTGGGVAVLVETQAACQLEIETEFTTFVEMVPAGRTRYLLTYLDRTDVRQI